MAPNTQDSMDAQQTRAQLLLNIERAQTAINNATSYGRGYAAQRLNKATNALAAHDRWALKPTAIAPRAGTGPTTVTPTHQPMATITRRDPVPTRDAHLEPIVRALEAKWNGEREQRSDAQRKG